MPNKISLQSNRYDSNDDQILLIMQLSIFIVY